MPLDYTMLLFDWDDSVAQVQTLGARSRSEALRMAEMVALTRPQLAGFQLWHRGARIAATFPVMCRASVHRAQSAVA